MKNSKKHRVKRVVMVMVICTIATGAGVARNVAIAKLQIVTVTHVLIEGTITMTEQLTYVGRRVNGAKLTNYFKDGSSDGFIWYPKAKSSRFVGCVIGITYAIDKNCR